MKNKTIAFWGLLIISITLFFFILNKQTEAKYSPEELDIELHFNRMNKYLNEQLAHSSSQNIIIEDILSQQSLLSDLVSQSPILVFRYSELNCSYCFETEILSLENIFAEVKQQIAILSSYRERRKFVLFNRNNRIEFPFFRIPQDAFNWILEDYGSPYYFVLHPDLTVSHIYIPDTTFPELNKQYLESVKKYLTE